MVRYLQKVATQCLGYKSYPNCVTSYYVKVASDAGDAYTDVCGIGSCPKLFTGNDPTRDLDAVVTNEFDWPIAARFVRLNPQTWNNFIAIYGCDYFN